MFRYSVLCNIYFIICVVYICIFVVLVNENILMILMLECFSFFDLRCKNYVFINVMFERRGGGGVWV